MAGQIQLTQTPTPRLTGYIYENWSIRMKVYFCWQDLWEIVDQGFEDPISKGDKEEREEAEAALTVQQKTTLKDLKRRDNKALFQIFQSVGESHFEKISAATTSHEACENHSK
ncbi:hypothetical protein Vadar_000092 [Vaccinium darrowii]|uniref:Uncharacterized protein n=1 Tax=Vaccinium darrowii TaxID=229202 RepID=A0ACB7XMD4_9ERIC|nr:hypothetical protein Vadar_000092 [Vaccinium darrowii]